MKIATALLALSLAIAAPSRTFGSDAPAHSGENLALCPRSVHKLVDTAAVLGLSRAPRAASPGELADAIRRDDESLQRRISADGGSYSDEQRLWYSRSVAPDPARVRIASSALGLIAQEVSFGDRRAQRDVLGWLGDARSLDIPLGGHTELVLADRTKITIAWVTPFNARATAPGPFHGLHAEASIPFMRQTGAFETVETGGDLLVRLPLKAQLSMWFYEPRSQDTLVPRNYPWLRRAKELMSAPRPTAAERVDLRIPRFTVHATSSVLATARKDGPAGALGLSDVFTVVPPLSNIVQATEFEVTESGVSITATTVGYGKKKPSRPPRTISIDRPFGYVVRDDLTDKLLMVGTVVQL